MLPPYISSDVKSTGEIQIFNYFETDPNTKNWIVLHSLNLTRHSQKIYGEIDFVVLAPGLGIFCLEVKSGDIRRENGIWKYINRFGRVTESPRSPFQQAREGMFGIKEAISRKFGSSHPLNRLLFGYGVLFPHIVFDIANTEIESWQIYDRNMRTLPVSEYIKKLFRHYKKMFETYDWFDRGKNIPSVSQVDSLAAFFRGDFEKIMPPKDYLNEIDQQLDNYTKEQFNCLDRLEFNDRCLFRGAAGTGKTMIALESARRDYFKNKKILLLCFNALLGRWISKQLPPEFNKNGSYAGNFHDFLSKITRKNDEIINDRSDEYFNTELPLLALEEIDAGRIEPFDVLILDEGQDLIRVEYLDVLNHLLKGGLSEGRWQILCDFERQAIFSSLSKEEMVKKLENRAVFTQYKLDINCRNTRPIGEEISLVCDIDESSYLPSKFDGAPVEYNFYGDENEKINKLQNILIKLRRQRIPANKITILSPYKYENSAVSKLPKDRFNINPLYKHGSYTIGDESIWFSTIQGYKGLENAVILLCDIDKIDELEFNKILYVGMSRAKTKLYVLMDRKIENHFNNIIKLTMKKKIIHDER
ncbi:MAG: NERD domain-containing protein [Patescibacteria group bacterium]